MASKDQETLNAFLMVGGSQVYQIEHSITKIGRSFDNDLVLKYPQISRKHAEIRFKNQAFEIVDINSTGGTFVNGIRIRQQNLSKGDVISLVNLHLVFEIGPFPDLTIPYQKPDDLAISSKDTKTLPNPSLSFENKEKEPFSY